MLSSSRTYLEQQGFRMTRRCTCGGSLTEQWQRPGPLVIVDLRVSKRRFRIRSTRPRIEGPIESLEELLGRYLEEQSALP